MLIHVVHSLHKSIYQTIQPGQTHAAPLERDVFHFVKAPNGLAETLAEIHLG